LLPSPCSVWPVGLLLAAGYVADQRRTSRELKGGLFGSPFSRWILAATFLLVGSVLAVFAVRTGTTKSVSVRSVPPATIDSAPATIAPLTTTAPLAITPSVAPSTTVAMATTTTVAEASPLAKELGPQFSVTVETPKARVEPVGLSISKMGGKAKPVRSVGLEPDGQLEIPNEKEIGWYRYGQAPGEVGSTVLAAHVSWNRALGPFADLATIEPGDRINVQLSDGGSRTYEAVERNQYNKGELPADRIWTRSGNETLVLITCGGEFNPAIKRYDDNIVIYAVPVAG
jgi:Sortase domain